MAKPPSATTARLAKPASPNTQANFEQLSAEDLAKLDDRYHAKTLRQKIEEMPVWLISLIMHLILMLMLALITTSSGQIGNIVLSLSPSHDDATTDLVEFSIDPVEWDDLPIVALIPEPIEEAIDSNMNMQPMELESQIDFAPVVPTIATTETPAPFSASEASLSETSAAKLTLTPNDMFAGRTGAMKQKLIKEFGGTQATEDAVELGLEWLKRQQLSDGSWSLGGPYTNGAFVENKVSATAMAMLAMMGAGSTHRGGTYKRELLRAVHWLVKQQDRQGFMSAAAADHEKMYAQAQAMIALCELYAMTGDSWIRPYAQASCDFACRAQSPEGGWRYQPRLDNDTSVTGWFVMGLKSGDAGGLDVDPYIWAKIEKYLDSVSSGYSGGYSYQVGEVPSPSMTAEGLLCRQYLGWHRNMPGMAQGLGALATNHPIDVRAPDAYYWYYATQSLHHYGGPLWTKWNDTLKVELPAQQLLRGAERGSWSPQNDAWGRYAGRLYTTCFSLYCLEVYYRHMPLYDANADTQPPRP